MSRRSRRLITRTYMYTEQVSDRVTSGSLSRAVGSERNRLQRLPSTMHRCLLLSYHSIDDRYCGKMWVSPACVTSCVSFISRHANNIFVEYTMLHVRLFILARASNRYNCFECRVQPYYLSVFCVCVCVCFFNNSTIFSDITRYCSVLFAVVDAGAKTVPI